MNRYLITGGAGFIGSHLADALIARGDSVVVLDDLSSGKRENLNPEANLIEGDLRDEDPLARALSEPVSGVFHLAAIASVERSVQDWPGTHGVNQTAFIKLLDHLVKRESRPPPVVYASSAAVYGDAQAAPLREDGPVGPLTPYGADKLACEHQAAVAGHLFGLRSFGLRFFNVYGARQDPRSPYSGVISIFRDRLAAGEPVTIFGDGGQTRDFIHVSDVVRALLGAETAASPEGPVANVCTGVKTSVTELAEVIAADLGKPLVAEPAPAKEGDIRHSCGAPDQAIELLDLTGPLNLADGLKRFER